MTIEGAIPEFSDRDVNLIEQSLPDTVNPQRRKLLAPVLRDWSRNELREHVQMRGGATSKRRKRVMGVEKCARKLLQALNAADEVDRAGIVGEIVLAAGHTSLIAGWAAIGEQIQRIDEEVSFLTKLEEAASRTWRRSRGHPRNNTAYLVMMDIAAIYEWLTEMVATREVDRDSGAETGPFWRFVSAIWPVVFGKAEGLSAGMKNWKAYRKKYGERSPLMANIAMRQRDMGIIPGLVEPISPL
jgi:hypothetical protein